MRKEEKPAGRARRCLGGACVIAFAAGAMAYAASARHAAGDTPRRPASPEEVAAGLARGVAWIWPDSNGPVAGPSTVPYRQAAVLVESMVLRARGVESGGRRRPLPLPAGTGVVPVVHVEAGPDSPDHHTPEQREAVLAAVRRHAGIAAAGSGWLQLDFEAPRRQREAYRALVASVREALPDGVRLSVTALAHWCTQGDWLDRLPVDEVVPMLYRLGPHADDWRRRFEQPSQAGALARRCRGPALGFATNDPPSPGLIARTGRPYWFDENAWSNPSHPPRHLAPSATP